LQDIGCLVIFSVFAAPKNGASCNFYSNLLAVTWSNTCMSPLLPRSTLLSLALLSACGGGGGGDQSASTGGSGSSSSGGATSTADSTDYSLAANWVCRPGSDVPCTTGLDAEVLNADGTTEQQPFTAAADPVIDCFYVYPTVSQEQTDYADLTDSPEIQAETREQVGRLSSRCRVFAPIYRQETSYGLNHGAPPSDEPFDDVQAAWAYYLQNYNQGRGVVLIGHSQGTILLQQLIAKSIDGTANQALLVSAFLAGDPSLGVPSGGVVGGTFTHIPTCSAAAQTGCVYVWGDYLAGDTSAPPLFGGARNDGLVSACVNPAAPGGGSGALKFYYAGANPPAWVEAIGQFTGACQAGSDGANIFVVTVLPGQFSAQNTSILTAAEVAPGWGIHPLDLSLVQGNILDVLDAEIATWQGQN
jgi:Protein of unknown function (DUF3089)